MTRTLKAQEACASDEPFFDPQLHAPFPWHGGKSRAAPIVWEAFGDVKNYVEPFAGSLAVLLARPHAPKVETVNDRDAWIANFWRAVSNDAEAVAHHANWPINEADLSARHLWLAKQRNAITEHITVDPEWYDVKVAGWWVWGLCQWIGVCAGWCDGLGKWNSHDGETWTAQPIAKSDEVRGIKHSMPLLQIPGGVHRYTDKGMNIARGVTRALPDLGGFKGVHNRSAMTTESLLAWFAALQARLRRVRVTCGDWERILGKTGTTAHGTTGVFLDPPYDQVEGADLYVERGGGDLSHAVGEWAKANGSNKKMRIVLCGYEGTFDPPDGWRTMPWCNGSNVGKGSTKSLKGRQRERLWLSPHCFVV